MLGLVTIDRPIRGELSLVYLRVMQELAAEHGVPVKAVPDTPSLAIPFELQDIAKK